MKSVFNGYELKKSPGIPENPEGLACEVLKRRFSFAQQSHHPTFCLVPGFHPAHGADGSHTPSGTGMVGTFRPRRLASAALLGALALGLAA